MPELPEVETTRRSVAPQVEGRRVVRVLVRNGDLREPVPPELQAELPGRVIERVERRGKYLLLRCGDRAALVHLGMSGYLAVVPGGTTVEKHDHLDIVLEDGNILRFNDPRRFGLVLWEQGDPLQHPLLASIGPEPLEQTFSGGHLFLRSRGRSVAVKQFIMDSRIVAGIGNIYASEALFRARIDPARPAGSLSDDDYDRLAGAIRETLTAAIADGGTTIRDFRVGEGTPGYFTVNLKVYDRAGAPCTSCGTPISAIRQHGRSTYFCSRCQW